MAASALAKQLDALQPEKRTRRGQASLLFDDREAEKYDQQTIYEIGLAGFSELCRHDAAFRQFEQSLFAASAKSFDRELRTQAENDDLNQLLTRFMRVLSAHYLLKAAAKVMEFFIRRYRVHVYNVDQVLSCILPHHETQIFARTVAVLQLSPTGIWAFLKGVASSGAPLPRKHLVLQASKDVVLQQFIMQAALDTALVPSAASSSGHPAVKLWLVVGTEQLRLGSPAPDSLRASVACMDSALKAGAQAPALYSAAGTLAAQLSACVALPSSLFAGLASGVAQHCGADMVAQGVLCLAAMYSGQGRLSMWTDARPVEASAASHGDEEEDAVAVVPELPHAAAVALLRLPSLPAALAALSETHDASLLVSALLRAALRACMKDSALQPAFLSSLGRVTLSPALAGELLRRVVEAFLGATEAQAEELGAALHLLCTAYPAATDAALHSVLHDLGSRGAGDKGAAKALQWISTVLSGTSIEPVVLTAEEGGDATSALAVSSSVTHPSAAVRARGIAVLSGMVKPAAAACSAVLQAALGGAAASGGAAGAAHSDADSGSDTSDDDSDDGDVSLADAASGAAGGLSRSDLSRLVSALSTLALARRTAAERVADDDTAVASAACDLVCELHECGHLLPPCLSYLVAALQHVAHDDAQVAKGLQTAASADAAWLSAHTGASGAAADEGLAAGLVQAGAAAVARASGAAWVGALLEAVHGHVRNSSAAAGPVFRELVVRVLPAFCGPMGPLAEADGAITNAATPRSAVTHDALADAAAAWDTAVAAAALGWWGAPSAPLSAAGIAVLEVAAAAAATGTTVAAVRLLSPGSSGAPTTRSGRGRKSKASPSATVPSDATGWTVVRGVALAALHAAAGPAGVEAPELKALLVAATTAHPVHGSTAGRWVAAIALTYAAQVAAGGVAADGEQVAATPSRRRRRSRSDSMDSRASAASSASAVGGEVALSHTPASRDALLRVAAAVAVALWSRVAASAAHLPATLLASAAQAPSADAVLAAASHGSDSGRALRLAAAHSVGIASVLLAAAAALAAADVSDERSTQVAAAVSTPLKLRDTVLNKHATCDRAVIVADLALAALSAPVSVLSTAGVRVLASLFRSAPVVLPSAAALCADHGEGGDAADAAAAKSSMTLARAAPPVGSATLPALQAMVTAPAAAVPPTAVTAALLVLRDCMQLLLGALREGVPAPADGSTGDAKMATAATRAVRTAVHDGTGILGRELPHALAMLPYLLAVLLAVETEDARAVACDALAHLSAITQHLLCTGIVAELDEPGRVPLVVAATAAQKLVAVRAELQSSSTAAHNALAVLLGRVSGSAAKGRAAARSLAKQLAGEESDVSVAAGRKRRGGGRKKSAPAPAPTPVLAAVAEATEEVNDMQLSAEHATALGSALADMSVAVYGVSPAVSATVVSALQRVQPAVVWTQFLGLAVAILGELRGADVASVQQVTVVATALAIVRRAARQVAEGDEAAPAGAMAGLVQLLQAGVQLGALSPELPVTDGTSAEYSPLLPLTATLSVVTQGAWAAASRTPDVPAELLEALGPLAPAAGDASLADVLLLWLSRVCSGAVAGAAGARAAQQTLLGLRLQASQVADWMRRVGLVAPPAQSKGKTPAKSARRKSRAGGAQDEDEGPPMGAVPPLLAQLGGKAYSAPAALGHADAAVAVRHAVVLAEVLVGKLSGVASASGSSIASASRLLQPLLAAGTGLAAALAPVWESGAQLQGVALETASSVEFALQLLLSATHSVVALQAQAAAAAGQAAEPVSEAVLPHLVQVALRASTVQGRTAALRLLAALATLAPRGVLSHILPVFVAVGTSADVTRGADATSAFRALGDILDHIVPCIAAHGRAAGISLPLLLRVFASLATALPVRDVGPLLERLLSAASSAATSVDTAALKQALAASGQDEGKVRITGRLRRARAAGTKANFAGALAAMLTSHAVQFAPAAATAEDPVRGDALLASALSAAPAGGEGGAASQLADATIAQLPGRSQVQALVEMARGTGRLLGVLMGPLVDEDEEEDDGDDAAMDPADALAANLAAAVDDKAAFAAPPSSVGAWLPLCTHDDGALRKLNLLQHVHELEMKAEGTQGALTAPQRLAVARARGTLGPSNLPMGAPGRQALVLGVLRAVSRVLSSADFIAATAPSQGKSAGDAAENDKQNTQFLRLADALFTSLAKAGSALEGARQAPPSAARRSSLQFWTAAVDSSLDALGHMSALLPVSSFVALISMLLRQASAAVRRRALVFLNERLEADVAAGISADEAVLYVQLLQELTELLGNESEPAPSRSTAAVSLHILAKHFAATHAEEFADCTRALVGVLLGTATSEVPVSGKRSRRGSKRARRTRETGAAAGGDDDDASVADSSVAGAGGGAGDAAQAALRASAALALSMLVEKASQLVVPHVPRVLPRLVADADQLVAGVRRSATVAAAVSAGSDSESDSEAASGAVSAAGAARAATEAAVVALRHVLVALQAFAQHLPKFLSRFVPDVLKLVLGPGLVQQLETPFDTPAGGAKGANAADSDDESAADSSEDEGDASDDGASNVGGSTASGATSDAGTSVLSGGGSTLLAAAVSRALSPADAAMSKGGIPAMAAAIREALGTHVAARVLVPHLSGVLGWAMDSSPAAAAGLMRILQTRLANLPRADVGPLHAAAHALVVSALDYRWLRGCYAGELGVTAVESAAVAAWMALVLHLSETQLRPLLLQLTAWRGAEAADLLLAAEGPGVWPVEGPSVAFEGGSLTESGGEASGLWAFAGLCRRIAFYHTLQALTVTLKTIAVPLYDGLLPDIAAELLALATAAVAGGEKRSRLEGDGAAAGSGSKRARGAGASDVGSASGDSSADDLSDEDDVSDGATDEEGESVGTADSDSDSDSDSDGAAEDFIPGGVPPSVKNNLCARRGSPSEVSTALAWEHEGRAVVHKDVKAGTVELLPSAGHTLRCLLLGCVTAAAASDSSKWFERTRLQQILVPLVAQFETPPSTAAGVNQPVQGCVPVPALVASDSPAAAAAAAKTDSGVHVDAARSGYRAFVTAYCLPAVGTLVSALSDDMLWKRLNHDLLMLTRDSRARVRLAGVWGCGEVFGQGREDALVLLPETIPFLAEAMEDADAEVEQQTNALVRRLEELSGESLQEFLTR